MDLTDTLLLKNRVVEIADAMGARIPSDRALTIWADSLKDLPACYVLPALTAWPRYHNRFPTIAELRDAASSSRSADLERDAAKEKADAATIDTVWSPDPAVARAWQRFRQARAAARTRADVPQFVWKEALLRYVFGRKLSYPKRRAVIAMFGEHPSEELVERYRQEINAQYALERQLPSWQDLLTEERAREVA